MLQAQQLINAENKTLNATLAEKYYRQALFYYFQHQPQKTLEQLAYNKAQLTDYTYNAQLFTAGLQLSEGMHNQSQQTLQQLAQVLSEQANDENAFNKAWLKIDDKRVAELEITSLQTLIQLQLAEHYISNNDFTLGKKALNKVAKIFPELTQQKLPRQTQQANDYFQQYHLLKQLAYWNDTQVIAKPPLHLTADISYSPYYLLNEAIYSINNKNVNVAEKILTRLQKFQWQAKAKSFWQSLFTSSFTSSMSLTRQHSLPHQMSDSDSDSDLSSERASLLAQELEQTAIQQYATLLLAQINVEQQNFEKSYQLMKGFPQESIFNEEALFLFAYSAYKIESFAESEVVFSLLVNKYPYSLYSYQALQLQAQQYLNLNDDHKALNQYLFIEEFYLKQIQAFEQFVQKINQNSDVLNFTQTFSTSENASLKGAKQLSQVVLSQADITYKLAQIAEVKQLTNRLLDKQKHAKRLAEIIAINNIRQQKIARQNNNSDFQLKLAKLKQSKEALVLLLNKAEQLKNGEAFADAKQQQWLTRIRTAQKAIENIAPHKNVNTYQERLNRVAGVLSWQLKQTYSERLWQHKTLLKQLTQKLNVARQQASTVNELLRQDLSLNKFKTKEKAISEKIRQLLRQNRLLEENLQQAAKKLIVQFASQQQQRLEQNLFISRQAMAQVIEQMNAKEEAL